MSAYSRDDLPVDMYFALHSGRRRSTHERLMLERADYLQQHQNTTGSPENANKGQPHTVHTSASLAPVRFGAVRFGPPPSRR